VEKPYQVMDIRLIRFNQNTVNIYGPKPLSQLIGSAAILLLVLTPKSGTG
jgi:hypothetical protein